MRISLLIVLGLVLSGCKPSTLPRQMEELERRMTNVDTRVVELEINLRRLVDERAAELHARQEQEKAKAKKPDPSPDSK